MPGYVDLVVTIEQPHPVRVAIDSIDTATVADELSALIRNRGRSAVRATIDGFHNPRRLRYRRGRNSPEGYYVGSFDYHAFQSMLLDPMGPGGSRDYRSAAFDYRTDFAIVQPLQRAPADAVLLVDGIFLQRSELARVWDLVIFVDVTFETAAARALERAFSEEGKGRRPSRN